MFQDAITEFWEWWADARADVVTEMADGGLTDDTIADIEDGVWRIHPELNWQITGGISAANSFNLVSGGARLLRLIAELWLRMGPGNDDIWEHHASRLPFALTTFEIDGIDFDPSEARFAATEDPLFERLDLVVAHPAFADTDEESAKEAAMHILDATIGEDAVERWLGFLEVAEAVDDGAPVFTARSVIERFAAGCQRSGWQDVSDQYDEEVRATVNRAVKWIDHLDKPFYAEVTITALAVEANGLPAPLEQKRIDALISDLLERLGDSAVLVGSAVGDGEHTVHLYVRPGTAASDAIDEWKATNDNREILVEMAPDEQWQNAEQWD